MEHIRCYTKLYIWRRIQHRNRISWCQHPFGNCSRQFIFELFDGRFKQRNCCVGLKYWRERRKVFKAWLYSIKKSLAIFWFITSPHGITIHANGRLKCRTTRKFWIFVLENVLLRFILINDTFEFLQPLALNEQFFLPKVKTYNKIEIIPTSSEIYISQFFTGKC